MEKFKLAKDLKIGDKCYTVDIDGSVSSDIIKKINIDNKDKKVYIEFENGVKGYSRFCSTYCNYGLYSSKVFFDKELAFAHLDKKINHIQKSVEKLQVL